MIFMEPNIKLSLIDLSKKSQIEQYTMFIHGAHKYRTYVNSP